MANEQGMAQPASPNLWFWFACFNCIANGSVHAALLKKSSSESETLVCHVQSFMRGVFLRVVLLGSGVQNWW